VVIILTGIVISIPSPPPNGFSAPLVICPPIEEDEEDNGGGGSRRRGSDLDSLREGRFGLHLDDSIFALWLFSSKQRKQRAFLASAGRHWENEDAVVAAESRVEEDGSREAGGMTAAMETRNDVAADWAEAFYDPSLPLAIDLGCGMGVSLPGLSLPPPTTKPPRPATAAETRLGIDWEQCNLVGVYLSALLIGYAPSVALRCNPPL